MALFVLSLFVLLLALIHQEQNKTIPSTTEYAIFLTFQAGLIYSPLIKFQLPGSFNLLFVLLPVQMSTLRS